MFEINRDRPTKRVAAWQRAGAALALTLLAGTGLAAAADDVVGLDLTVLDRGGVPHVVHVIAPVSATAPAEARP